MEINNIRGIVKESITLFSKRHGVPFWLSNTFCLKRNEINKDNPCDNCESNMCCSISHAFISNSIDLHKAINRANKFQFMFEHLEELVKMLASENKKLKQELKK